MPLGRVIVFGACVGTCTMGPAVFELIILPIVLVIVGVVASTSIGLTPIVVVIARVEWGFMLGEKSGYHFLHLCEHLLLLLLNILFLVLNVIGHGAEWVGDNRMVRTWDTGVGGSIRDQGRSQWVV